jgi:hypothetical protein
MSKVSNTFDNSKKRLAGGAWFELCLEAFIFRSGAATKTAFFTGFQLRLWQSEREN